MTESNATPGRFGTFAGVFRPTVLTILGALLFLRQGWVVGHAGLGGFLAILLGMYAVTTATALSMASMTSNIRIGHGGVFSLISQSMGLEAGGAIGVPFYLAQSLGAALYLYAFAEAWAMLFPSHPSSLVVLGAFAVVAALSMLGAQLAFRTQSIVMLGSVAALVSMAMGLSGAPTEHVVEFYHDGSDESLASLFALFFPAATGILVGASMSGSLSNARKSIPRGTLAAVGTSFAIYVCAGVWFALVASPEELRASTTIAFERAASAKVVAAGVLASTFSAALSSMVAAPRVLQALGAYGVLPFGDRLAKTTPGGEPRMASFVTGVIVALGLSSGSLNSIASLLTVFFLITYASLNLVVLVEQWLDLPSFRPTFRISKVAPAIGVTTSVLAILATSPVFGLVAFFFVLALYAWLVRRRLPTPFETARSGLLGNIAAWAARKIGELPSSTERSWKPDLLVPVSSAAELAGSYTLLRAVAGTKGSVHVVGFSSPESDLDIAELRRLSSDLLTDGTNSKAAWANAERYGDAVSFTMSILQGAFLPPNIVFLSLDSNRESELQEVTSVARNHHFGVVLRVPHAVAGLGQERTINVWVRDQSPDWHLSLKMASIDLSILVALQIRERWRGQIRLITVVGKSEDAPAAEQFLTNLCEQARIPAAPAVHVLSGDFHASLRAAPPADLNVFGLPEQIQPDAMRGVADAARSTCLYVLASGRESALA